MVWLFLGHQWLCISLLFWGLFVVFHRPSKSFYNCDKHRHPLGLIFMLIIFIIIFFLSFFYMINPQSPWPRAFAPIVLLTIICLLLRTAKGLNILHISGGNKDPIQGFNILSAYMGGKNLTQGSNIMIASMGGKDLTWGSNILITSMGDKDLS